MAANRELFKGFVPSTIASIGHKEGGVGVNLNHSELPILAIKCRSMTSILGHKERSCGWEIDGLGIPNHP
jgi:hypothetical protein